MSARTTTVARSSPATTSSPSSRLPSPMLVDDEKGGTPHLRFGVPAEAKEVEAVHPHTPLHVVQRLAHASTQRKHREREAAAAEEECVPRATHEAAAMNTEDADMRAVLTHPPELFTDEDAVLYRFGMGGRTSPTSAPGFHGLFRQRWQDFHVTEMVSDWTAPLGARAVSRQLSFAIPPLPSHLLCQTSEAGDRRTAGSSSPSVTPGNDKDDGIHRDSGACRSDLKASATPSEGVTDDKEEEGPDESFFHVDVKAQLAGVLRESVSAADLAAATHALQKAGVVLSSPVDRNKLEEDEREKTRGVHSSSETASATSAATVANARTKEGHACSAHALAATAHSLKQLEQTEEALMQVGDGSHAAAGPEGRFYLQCTLHKQHIAHSVALAHIAQTLRVHPRALSTSGIKDYIGDTVQRIRIENVSPTSALRANRAFRRKRWRMTLSDFSYETAPLVPGDLFGNHFRIVLRDVTASKADLDEALHAFQTYGFPNYYGCQRFSWFAGRQDAAMALLRHNWLAFAFRFLNFTSTERTLRQLLQREKKYPHPVQDQYRRGVVRRLRHIGVEPKDLDVDPFLTSPSLSEPLVNTDGQPYSQKHQLVLWQLRGAFFDLDAQSRRLTAQRLSSYLWNQALTLRLHHFGGQAVLEGDMVLPASLRQLGASRYDRASWLEEYRDVVSEANASQYTIRDVLHPGFSFNAAPLPANPIGAYYLQLCERYHLDWDAKHAKSGLTDFYEPPRPIVRFPLNLTYTHTPQDGTLTVQFALERGCYANVAISELMKCARCAGADKIATLPVADALWDSLGQRDPGYVTTMQDVYKGFQDGLGFMNETVSTPLAEESEGRLWDYDGPLFLPASEDPAEKARRWSTRHLLRNSERREKDAAQLRRQLFEPSLAKRVSDDELARYAGHTVPTSPNMRGKRVFFQVLRRKRRYAGAPKSNPGVKRGAQIANRNHKRLPHFGTLNKDSWNVTW